MHPLLLVGGNPYTTTSIYLLIQYLEWKWGVYYGDGGTRSIVNGFKKLFSEEGIECNYNTEVIEVVKNKNHISKVISNKGDFDADIIVSNSDPSYFYSTVLKTKPKKYLINQKY